jgi:hypothetical protein
MVCKNKWVRKKMIGYSKRKKLFTGVALMLSLSILSSYTIPVITYATELDAYEKVQLEDSYDTELLPETLDENLNLDSITNFISERVVDDKNIQFTDDGVYIDGKFYTPEEFDKLLDQMEDPTEVTIELTGNTSGSIQSRAFYIPAIGYATTWVYTVPGIGQIAVVATAAVAVAYGSYIFGKTIIKSGHWAYNRIRTHVNARPRPKNKSVTTYNYQKSVSKRDFIAYKYNISNKILDSNGKVKIRDFRDKFGNPPKNTDGKSSKRFKNGRYDIQKDRTNHKGRYKLNKDGKRVATVDGDGTISGK